MDGLIKGMIPTPDGRTVIRRLLDEFAAAGIDEAILVANDRGPYEHLGVTIVPDIRPGLGPLAGIEAALTWSTRPGEPFDAVAFLPCDLPRITATEISALIAAFHGGRAHILVAETGKGFCQALCCVVHNDALPRVAARIDRGLLGVSAAWCDLGAATVHFDDEAAFANLNTPNDLDQWKALEGKDL